MLSWLRFYSGSLCNFGIHIVLWSEIMPLEVYVWEKLVHLFEGTSILHTDVADITDRKAR